ncbi:phosphonate C-P lyase system protein PhnG [Paenibacillus alkalitolerans]|uniref:phosphonate C-P lyase system protein PhnG n=1 Tax=Paenibacillus alkalitolerans TaxID=2799335 RepID=UPI0018F54B0F|nr:phosphonate C-P lyase system protein PhnG [Paenibacillus alkalitolerans]
MNRSQITRVLIEGDRELLRKLCGEIESRYPVSIVRAPEKSLVMSKARDSVSQQPFFIGEVLITECTVAVEGTHGFGALIGEDAEKAYELAVVDAAMNAKLPATEGWISELLQEEERIAARLRKKQSMVMRTKVNFDTMEESYGKRS